MESSKRRARLAGVITAAAAALLAGPAVAHAVAGSGRATSAPAPVTRSAALADVTHATPASHGSDPAGPGGIPGRAGTAPGRPAAHPASNPQGHGRPVHPPRPAPGGSGHPVAGARPAPAASLAAQLLAGVGRIPPGWVASAHTLVSGGLSRVYLTVEPARPADGIPIVLLMHGRLMTPGTVLRISGLADRLGPAVLVVPAGWDRSWNAGDCCGAAYRAGVNDVGFIRSVLAEVVAATPGGRQSKVYAVGFSNGGRLAYLLACDMPSVFTAFVAVEAVPVEACTPTRPLSITMVAQQSDPLLTVDRGRPKRIYGYIEPTVAATLARLEGADHCSGGPTVTDAGQSVERTWRCADGTSLRYVWYPSGAHDWRPARGRTPGATDYVLQTLGIFGTGQQPGGPGPDTASVPFPAH